MINHTWFTSDSNLVNVLVEQDMIHVSVVFGSTNSQMDNQIHLQYFAPNENESIFTFTQTWIQDVSNLTETSIFFIRHYPYTAGMD